MTETSVTAKAYVALPAYLAVFFFSMMIAATPMINITPSAIQSHSLPSSPVPGGSRLVLGRLGSRRLGGSRGICRHGGFCRHLGDCCHTRCARIVMTRQSRKNKNRFFIRFPPILVIFCDWFLCFYTFRILRRTLTAKHTGAAFVTARLIARGLAPTAFLGAILTLLLTKTAECGIVYS